MATIKVNKDDKWINILAGSSSYTKEEIDKALTNVNKTIVTNIENSKTEINNNINTISTNIDTKIEDTKTSLTDELNKKANKVDVYYKNVLYTKEEVDDRIAKAKPNIDLTPYATKEELNRFKPDLSNYVTHSELSKYTVVERLGLKDVTYNYNLKTNDVSEYTKIKRRHMNWNIDFKDREDKYHHFQFNVTASKDIVINVEGTQEQDIRYTFTDGSSFCIKLIFKLKKLIPVGKNVSILERETIRPEMFIANNNELPDTVRHTFLDNYNTDQVGTITVGIKTTYLDNTFDITYCRLTINSRNIELEDYSSITNDGVYTLNIEKYYNTVPSLPNNDKARKLIIPASMSHCKEMDFSGWTNLEEIEIKNVNKYVFQLRKIKDTKLKNLENVVFYNNSLDKEYNISNYLSDLRITLEDYGQDINYINNKLKETYSGYAEKKILKIFLQYIKDNNLVYTPDNTIYLGNQFDSTKESYNSDGCLLLSYIYNLKIYNKEKLFFIFQNSNGIYQDISLSNTNTNTREIILFGYNGYGYLDIRKLTKLEKVHFFIMNDFRITDMGDCYISNNELLKEINIVIPLLSIYIDRLRQYIRFETLPKLTKLNIYTVYSKATTVKYIKNLKPKLFEGLLYLEHFSFINNDKLDTSVSEEIRNHYPIVPEIPFACFRGCVKLKEIIIMPSTTLIQTEAYTNCSSARYIHFIGTTPPTINGEPFKGVNCDMYVPDSAVDAYKIAYPQYASRIKPDSTLVLTDEEKLYN